MRLSDTRGKAARPRMSHPKNSLHDRPSRAKTSGSQVEERVPRQPQAQASSRANILRPLSPGTARKSTTRSFVSESAGTGGAVRRRVKRHFYILQNIF